MPALIIYEGDEQKIDRIRLADIDADLVIRFLDWLEVNRGNSASTRNVRLAAIHAFFGMCSSKIQKCCCIVNAFLQFQ